MAIDATPACKRCLKAAGELKVYRDPFAQASAPGQWPAIKMHSDCFLKYIQERKAARVLVLSSTSGHA
jgi:hypothetical protein